MCLAVEKTTNHWSKQSNKVAIFFFLGNFGWNDHIQPERGLAWAIILVTRWADPDFSSFVQGIWHQKTKASSAFSSLVSFPQFFLFLISYQRKTHFYMQSLNSLNRLNSPLYLQIFKRFKIPSWKIRFLSQNPPGVKHLS